MFIAILALYAVCSVGGLTCFKLGAQQSLHFEVANSVLSIQISWLSILGIFMYIMSFLIYLSMVSKMQLSYLMPISTGVIYLLTMIVSLIVFKDPITVNKLIGAGLVLGGIILMNVKK